MNCFQCDRERQSDCFCCCFSFFVLFSRGLKKIKTNKKKLKWYTNRWERECTAHSLNTDVVDEWENTSKLHINTVFGGLLLPFFVLFSIHLNIQLILLLICFVQYFSRIRFFLFWLFKNLFIIIFFYMVMYSFFFCLRWSLGFFFFLSAWIRNVSRHNSVVMHKNQIKPVIYSCK